MGAPVTTVDETGKPVVDPTKNVLDLVEASVTRADDLRAADRLLNDTRIRHLTDMMTLRAGYDQQLRDAESKRIDAIRSVDVNAVAVANQRSVDQASVLATQVAASAEALRGLVATTAAAAATALQQVVTPLASRLTALEQAQALGAGRQAVSDPALTELNAAVQRLIAAQANAGGKSEGIGTSWLVLLGAVSLIATLLSIGSIVFALTRVPDNARVVYEPAPREVAAPLPAP